MQAKEKEWLAEQKTRFERLRDELAGALEFSEKTDTVGNLQKLEIRLTVLPPWRRT